MKSFKNTVYVFALAILACAANAQQPATTPAVVLPTAPVIENKNQDRSYVADYADKKASLALVDKANSKETPMSIKSVEDKKIIFVDNNGTEFPVDKKSKTFEFAVKTDENFNRARAAYAKSDWNEVVVYMRPLVYPLLPATALSEDICKANLFVEMYITALINADRLNEATALAKELPLADVPVSTLSAVFDIGNALCEANRLNDASAIADKVQISADNIAVMPDFMAFLGNLRKLGATKQCAVWYTKLSNMPDNPMKNQAVLWMVYCDLQMGNKLSAEVYLSTLKVERSDVSFSLLQMIKGMLKASGEKPDIKGALDSYSEGIVFGSYSNPWMPELLFNAGMAYKAIKNFYASNEIFAQISALYPNDSLAARGMKEIVKIEKKKRINVDDEDEDEEDEEDEE